MNIPDEATMASYDALCAIYWPDTQTYDVATADLDTVSETVYTVLEAAWPHMKDATPEFPEAYQLAQDLYEALDEKGDPS